MKTKLDYKTLASVIYSSVMTLNINTRTGKMFSESDIKSTLQKVISFNLQPEHDLVVVGEEMMLESSTMTFSYNKFDALVTVENKLKQVLNGGEIEFIFQDPITKSVIIFTEEYVDKLVSGEIPVGTLAINYMRQWYSLKCGPGRKKTREHHERFKTFSQREIQYLERTYIPIIVAPKELAPVYNLIDTMIQISPLADYIVKDIGFNVHGKKVDSSIALWLPRIVGKEYLEVQDDHQVLSQNILKKLVVETGFLGKPPVERPRIIPKGIITHLDSSPVDDFILSKNNMMREKYQEEKIKAMISEEVFVEDNLIPENAGLIKLDY